MNKRKHFLPRSLSLLLSLACRIRRLEPGDILLVCFAPRGHGRGGVGEIEEEKDRRRECVFVKNSSTSTTHVSNMSKLNCKYCVFHKHDIIHI